MHETSNGIWVYLAAHPLFWLTATLGAFILAEEFAARFGRPPWANPVLIASLLLISLLLATGTDYATYFQGAQFIHFLLGPATVALAVPLYRNLGRVRALFIPMMLALVSGSLVAIISAVLLGRLMGLPREVVISLAPKSVTMPIAMSLAENLGGVPALTACFVLLTGIFGAISVTALLNLLRIKDFAARGFAVGLSAHGIGVARALQCDPVAGAFAGIALGLNGALTSMLVPVVLPWLL
ncbi:LrgB family protein [Beijerinckia indica]|uniref:LrgB family protein n=1 Tax=Beijerinckia indica subsp. indica (strain ATCC 9039 / DSM 1715 / NCIMB 8712) TaxID=395963 RepID=B2IEH9_BEII9|nr:LrgB family protein [Beijerinckia indica]ACB95577.1 LrgB family protein [Beijerinckia indica subsp. indica ATCC 9039]